ncbi:MAG: beta-lactamase family protein, partial [Anaerolineaceae bacterium]|nr:beta-lactamase family protein [Anaerolineaceae bacterium]
MKKINKIIKGFFAIIFLLIAVLFISLSLYNSPVYALRILTLLRSDTMDYKIFPSRAIENPASFSRIEKGDLAIPDSVEYRYREGARVEMLEDLLKRTGTHAFLVIKDDQLIYETYLESSREDLNTSFSVAKSFDSALIGAAIADGLIGSLDDPVIKYIPEIAWRGLDTLTIRNLLRMDTGIRYRSESDVIAPFSDDALTYYPPNLRKVALNVEAGGSPI